MLSLYHIVYNTAVLYSRWKHATHKWHTRLMRGVAPDNAIQRVELIDLMQSEKRTIAYEFGYLHTLYNWFMMSLFNKPNAHCKLSFRDARAAEYNHLIYVRLINGSEFITRNYFHSLDTYMFKRPKKHMLHVQIGIYNATQMYKRFIISWDHLHLKAIDFILLATKLDTNFRKYFMVDGFDIKLSAVDDETFQEKQYADNENVF